MVPPMSSQIADAAAPRVRRSLVDEFTAELDDSDIGMIAAALAEPQRLRARWDLLILTGGLRWRTQDGDLEDGAGEPILDDFHASP